MDEEEEVDDDQPIEFDAVFGVSDCWLPSLSGESVQGLWSKSNRMVPSLVKLRLFMSTVSWLR